MGDGKTIDRTGKCLCGAVSFTAKDVSSEVSACHCGMCLRWSGGPLISAMTKTIEWHSDETLGVVTSSAWAERGFCSKCGSGLFYRMTSGKYQGNTSILLGALDDRSGFAFTKEWFIDNKPEAYAFAGERSCLTEAQIMAAFGADLTSS